MTNVRDRNVFAEPPPAPWAEIDRSGDPEYYVRYLDQARELGMGPLKAEALARLRLEPGETVLDLGCGTGDDTSGMAAIVGIDGRAVGVDVSATMIGEARARFGDLRTNLEFHEAPGEALPFEDEAFDACFVERVLQHVADPTAVVAEIHRVLRPGGRVVLFEPDWGLSIVDYLDDDDLVRRIEPHRLAYMRSMAPSAYVGRQLVRVLKRSGFVGVTADVRGMTIAGEMPGFADRVRRVTGFLRETGQVAEGDIERIVARAEEADTAGDWFSATVMFLVTGTKAGS